MEKVSPEDQLEKDLVKAAVPLIERYLQTFSQKYPDIKKLGTTNDIAVDIAEKLFPDAIEPFLKKIKAGSVP